MWYIDNSITHRIEYSSDNQGAGITCRVVVQELLLVVVVIIDIIAVIIRVAVIVASGA